MAGQDVEGAWDRLNLNGAYFDIIIMNSRIMVKMDDWYNNYWAIVESQLGVWVFDVCMYLCVLFFSFWYPRMASSCEGRGDPKSFSKR